MHLPSTPTIANSQQYSNVLPGIHDPRLSSAFKDACIKQRDMHSLADSLQDIATHAKRTSAT
jgi:hypothetical protein